MMDRTIRQVESFMKSSNDNFRSLNSKYDGFNTNIRSNTLILNQAVDKVSQLSLSVIREEKKTAELER